MPTSDQQGRIDASGDFSAGHYAVTHTVWSNRVNLFYLEPGKERHIGTLVSGSRSKIEQFHEDAKRIVIALAQTEAAPQEREK